MKYVDPSGHAEMSTGSGGFDINSLRWDTSITANWTINEMKQQWHANPKKRDYWLQKLKN